MAIGVEGIKKELSGLKGDSNRLRYLERNFNHPGKDISDGANRYMAQLLGDMYAKAGNFGKAGRVLRDVKDFDKAGEMYAKQGLLDDAASMFEQSGNLSKAGVFYAKAGKDEERRNEENARSLYFKSAETFAKAGDKKRSKSVYRKLGTVFEKLKRPVDAGDMYERADAHEQAGKAYEKAGELKLAVRSYAEAGNLKQAQQLYDQLEKGDPVKKVIHKVTTGRSWDRGEAEQLVSLRRLLRSKQGQKGKTLEQAIAVIAGISFVGALVFLSSSLTGNVIGSLNQTSSNWIGGVLFIIGLVGAFAYFKKR